MFSKYPLVVGTKNTRLNLKKSFAGFQIEPSVGAIGVRNTDDQKRYDTQTQIMSQGRTRTDMKV